MASKYKKDLIRDVLTIIDDDISRELLLRLESLSEPMVQDLYASIMSNSRDKNNKTYLKYTQRAENGAEKLKILYDKFSLTQEITSIPTNHGNS